MLRNTQAAHLVKERRVGHKSGLVRGEAAAAADAVSSKKEFANLESL